MAISHYSILILEDSPEDRSLYCHYLSQNIVTTYDFIEIETGSEALTQLEETSPDLILLDYQLPDMDALEFLNNLRLQSGRIKIPVIMLVEQGDATIAVQALKSGAQDYLVKGKLTSTGLCRAVHATLEKTRLMQQIRMQEQQQQLLAGISLHIRQFLRLEEILSTAVEDVREFLKADRVIVSQLDTQMNGKIVAESVLPQWKTLLNCEIQDSCFRENQRIAYLNGKIQAISDIHHAGLKASYVDILEQFEVKANLIVPILLNTEATDQVAFTNQLWGLLIAHQCSGTREWETNELGILHQLSVQMAVAIQQAELYQNLQNLNTSLEQKVQERTKELQTSERRFRAIFNNTFQFTGLLTTAGIVLEANQTALNFGGLQLEDVINRPFWETYWWTISSTTQDRLKRAIARAEKGEFIRYEVDILGAGGQIATIDFSLRPLKNESEQIVMLIVEGRDISEKKRLERERQEALKALEASASEFRGLFNAMVDVILVIDKQGRYLKIAPTNADKLYLPAEELLGKTLHEVLPDHLADQFMSVIEQTLATQQLSECEYNLQIGNKEVWFSAKVSPISPETVIWAARDITAAKRNEIIRQQTEKALQENQILLQCVMDSLPIAIFWKDRNCRYLGCNRQLLLDAGLSSTAEIIGKTDFDMVWREQAPLYQLDDRIVMESGQPKFNIEEQLTKHGNIHRWLHTNKIPMQNAEGEIIGVVANYEDITERKQIEQALEESKQRYATLVTSAPVGIYHTDTEGNCLYVNDNWCENTGLTPQQAAGRGWQRALHPEDRDMIKAQWQRLVQTGEKFSLEYRFLRPDGLEIWVFGQAVPEKDPAGTVTGYVGTITNITSRKQTEQELQITLNKLHQLNQDLENQVEERTQALQNSEKFLNSIIENLPNMIFVKDADKLKFVRLNKAAENLLGYAREEMIGKSDYDFFPEGADFFVSKDRQTLASQGICEILEEEIHTKNQGIRILHTKKFAITDEHGKSKYLVGISEDITEPKKAEQIIRQQAEREHLLHQTTQRIRQSLDLATIFNTATEEIRQLINADRVGIFQFASDSNFNGGEFVSESVVAGFTSALAAKIHDHCFAEQYAAYYQQGRMQVVDDIDNAGLSDCYYNILAQFQVRANLAVPLIQGENLWGLLCIHQCSQPRHWQDFEIQLVQQIANQLAIAIQQADLFEQLQLSLVQEKEVSQMRSRFISMASHEFRTPLAIISSSTGILQNFSDRLSPEKKQRHLETIQKTIQHIVQLLDDVLMINRAEAEKMEFKPEALDIIAFCYHLKEQIEGTSSKHTIEFCVNASEPILDNTLVVQFDPKIIRQILTNILSNAIKYSPENSLIDFSLTRENEQLIFKIKDSGIGIPEKDKVNLFAFFHRASNVGNISGTGLGLAIVKKCVDLHKGKITLDSQINEGTTFTVSIPLLSKNIIQLASIKLGEFLILNI
ncbi:PAS domain S-box protein [Dolichospermum sp. ST_sed9]|nr:PAS domain S-box protein [Dolichospermum sp. ST_sed9]